MRTAARRLSLAIALLGGVATFPAAGESALAAGRQAELRHLLTQDCGSCHGMTMKGGLGPALLPANLDGKPDELLVISILDGRPGTAMPPWRGLLTEAEAQWLVEQLREGVE
ncbi:MAG: c-type cytochrome [Gammaproteobacteria bacterium]